MPALGGRFHWPDQSGYFDKSRVCALASELMRATEATKLNLSMVILLVLVAPKFAGSRLSVLEIFQVGWRLALAHRHQEAVGADIVVVLADLDVTVVLGAIVLEPHHVLGLAHVLLGHGPGPRERLVEGGDLVDENIAIALVEIDALLD